MADLVNDDRSRLEGVEHSFEAGIEHLDEPEVRAPARSVLRKIEAGHADKIDAGEVMSGAQCAANRQAGGAQLLQASEMRFRRPGLRRTVGEPDRLPKPIRDGEQASELIVRKPPEPDPPVRFPFEQAPQT